MDRNQKLNNILEAALKIFARYGFKKTTVEDVAAALGMTKGNLYLYVLNKKDLYEKTVAQALRRWQNRVAEAVAREQDPSRQFMVLGRKAFEYLSQDHDLRQVLENDPSIFPLSSAEDRFQEINRASIDMLAGVIQKGIDQGRFGRLDVPHVSEFLFSLYVMFIIKTYVKSEGLSTGLMFEQGLALILRGLENTNPAAQAATIKEVFPDD